MLKGLLAIFIAFIPLNVVGIDPGDVLSLILLFTLLFIKPRLFLFNELGFIFKIFSFIFLFSFLIANYFGFETRMLVAILINISIFIVLYYFLLEDDEPFPLAYALSISFILSNISLLILNYLGIETDVLFELFRDGRYLGSFGDPNFTGFTAVITFIYLIDRVVKKSYSNQSRLVDGILLSLSSVIILLSESRSAWGSALVSLLFYFAVLSGDRRRIFIPAALFGLVAVLTVSAGESFGNGQFGAIAERARTFVVQDDSAEADRFEFLYSRMSLAVGLEHPLGIGAGTTAAYTGLVNADGMPIGAHNSFVQIFTEFGWASFVSLVVLLLIATYRIIPRALNGWMLNDVSCRVIFALMMGQVVFAMAHDMIAWRISWFVPALAICATFARIREGFPLIGLSKPENNSDDLILDDQLYGSTPRAA